MKKMLCFIISALWIGSLSGMAHAGSSNAQVFQVAASIPSATGINITVTSINSATSARTVITGTSLSFDPMAYNAANGIWLPDHYFSIDVGTSGGTGTPTVVFTYTDGTNPNGSGKGLGWKSTATFFKVAGTTETALTAHGPKKMLKDLSGETIASSELTGSFLRVYLGIVAKDPAAKYPDPASSDLFTNADQTGTYTGSLLVSATIA